MGLAELLAASRFGLSQNALTVQIGNLFFVSSTLPFNMQSQTQTNWCWAATATSVSLFYYSASGWTQCKVANGELSRTDCCDAPVPSPCNIPWYLDRALQRTSNFQSMVSGTIGYDAINAEITAGRPIGARIGWSGGGGHFMVIYGCSRVGGVDYVDIDDPIYGKSHLTLATFTNSYQGNGHWTHTYYTKRWPAVKIKLPPLEARLVDLIGELRPLLALKRGEREFAARPNVSLAVPHHVFVLGLNDLVGRDDPAPQKPTALRVFETMDGRNRAVFEVTTPDQTSPQIQSMSDDAKTIEALQRGLAEATRLAEQSDAPPELRFLRIPALYVEAFWLHYPDRNDDLVVPVRALGLFEPLQSVRAQQFFERLRAAARERLEASRDPTIAP